MEFLEEIESIIETLDNAQGKVGNIDDIDSLNTDLIFIKEFIGKVADAFKELTEDVSNLNTKNFQLQSSNNQLFRQLGAQQDKMEKARQELSAEELIDTIIG